MNINVHEVTITVDASGDGTGYSGVINGMVLALQYIKTDYADGVDLAVATEETAIGLATYTNMNIATGVSTWDGDGPALDTPWPIHNERIKLTISDGGNATTGKFRIWVDGAS